MREDDCSFDVLLLEFEPGFSLDILSDRLDECRDGRVRTRVGVIGYVHHVVDTDE